MNASPSSMPTFAVCVISLIASNNLIGPRNAVDRGLRALLRWVEFETSD